MKKPDKRNGAIIFPQKAGNKTAFLETVKETKTIPLQAIFQRVEGGGGKIARLFPCLKFTVQSCKVLSKFFSICKSTQAGA